MSLAQKGNFLARVLTLFASGGAVKKCPSRVHLSNCVFGISWPSLCAAAIWYGSHVQARLQPPGELPFQDMAQLIGITDVKYWGLVSV